MAELHGWLLQRNAKTTPCKVPERPNSAELAVARLFRSHPKSAAPGFYGRIVHAHKLADQWIEIEGTFADM